MITLSITPQATSDHPVQWMKLPSLHRFNTRTIPNYHIPVIKGGRDLQYVPTSDADDCTNKWEKVPSLPSLRKHVAVVPIDSDTMHPRPWRLYWWRRCCRSSGTFHHYSGEGKSYPHTKSSCYSYRRHSVKYPVRL